MTKYDDIVLGSGVSGLSMALLLGRAGRKVLLLEKARHAGGSIARFTRKGVAFDVGFHFTGGMQDRGILSDILKVLGIRDRVSPLFLPDERSTVFVLEDAGRSFDHPTGIERIKKRFTDYFPGEASAIDRYFDMVVSVCRRTPSLDLRSNVIVPNDLDEDHVSLDEVLRGLTGNTELRGLLSGYAMLYGVQPREISFANHSRMCLSFYESIACFPRGGDTLVDAFRSALGEAGVELRTGTTVRELADIRDQRVGRFVLTSGEEVAADNCVLTVHPQEIVRLLPQGSASRAFVSRVESFEPSAGFFSVFATLAKGVADPYPDQAIVSLFPTSDVNDLLDPAYRGDPALVVIKPSAAGGEGGVHILAPSFPERTAAWQETRTGSRPKDYYAYKEHQVEAVLEHIYRRYPAYRGGLNVVDSATMLTFRDYLHSPDGSAYGIKQKIGQYNVVGKLPLRNLYAAGQSAVLPGVIGAMMSSLIVGRALLGKDRYGEQVGRALCN